MRQKTKDILLIIPPYDMSRIMQSLKEDITGPSKNIQMYPFIGISQIGSILLKNNFNVHIYDCSAEHLSLSDVIRLCNIHNPLFVGIYVNSFSLYSVYRIIRFIKEKRGDLIVVGGPHITARPSSIKYLNADFGIVGEAEEIIVKFADHLINGDRCVSIPGLVNREEEIKTVPVYVENIDMLPFMVRPEKYKNIYYSPFYSGPIATTIASRGCPFRCIFCASSHIGRYRLRSVENVLDEIKLISALGYRYLQFQDDTFNINRRWLYEFCEGLISLGLNRKVGWDCNIRAELIERDDFDLLKRSGCKMIRLGVETANDSIRQNVLNKDISIKQIQDVISIAHRYSIKVLGYFMIGLPHEEPQDLLKTINFIKGSEFDYIDISISVILPSTPMEKWAIEEGIIQKDFWEREFVNNPDLPIWTRGSEDRENLIALQREALIKFYFSSRYILKELKNSIDERRIKNTIRASLRLLFDYRFK